MEQGLKIVTEYGEFIQPSMLTPESINKLSDEQLEAITEYIRLFASYKAKLETELKQRINNGSSFEHATTTTSTSLKTGDLPSTAKAEFLKNWGWDAFELKTPAKLKKRFGSDIEKDIEKVGVYDTTEKFNWKQEQKND